MPALRSALLAAALLAFPSSLAADQLSGSEIAEVSHEVEARVLGDRVELTVRRAFVNRSPSRQSVRLSIGLPSRAVARGMRVRTGRRWHRAALLGADEAERRYHREPPGAGAPDQAPALLSWMHRGRLLLRIHPIEAGAVAAVEYQLLAPTEPGGSRVRFHYPLDSPSSELLTPTIRVSGKRPGDRVWIDGEAITPGVSRSLLSPGPGPRSGASALSSAIEVSDPPAHVVRARARVFLSHEQISDLAIELRGPAGRSQALAADRDRLAAGADISAPLLEAPAGTWKLAARDRSTGGSGTLHGWRIELTGVDGKVRTYRSRRPLEIPDAIFDDEAGGGEVEIEVASDPGALSGSYGAVDLAGGGSLFRFHLDAPARLGEVPDELRVVFVLDASRSMSPRDTRSQLEAAAAYLAQAPGARFEIVRFDRRARRLLGRFAAAGELPAIRRRLVAGGELERRNGSALERGLATAARALAGAGGTPRIVVLSDLLVRSRFRNRHALRALARGPRAVTHLATLGGGGAPYARLDDHALAPIAASRGDMTVSLPVEDAALRRGALALIRPIQIDHLAASGPAKPRTPAVLGEGEGLRFTGKLDARPRRSIEVTGSVWQRPVRQVIAASPDDDARAAALAFGDPVLDALADTDIEPLALRGQVVSPATSLLTTRPGKRPRDIYGGIGMGTTCGGRCGGAFGTTGVGTGRISKPLSLAGPMARCAAKLPGAPLRAVATVETSYSEIVDVEVEAAPALRRCLTEEIWRLELEPAHSAGPLHRRRIVLGD